MENKIEQSIKNIEKSIEKKGKKWEKEITEKDIIAAILIIVGIVLAFFVYVNFIPKEGKMKAEIIKIEGCEECFDLSLISSGIKEDIEIKEKSLDYTSDEAKEIMKRYKIEKTPALIIISKNIDKLQLDDNLFEKSKNYAIFTKGVPYLEDGKVKGLVNFKEVYDPTCKECTSLSNLKNAFERSGIKIGSYEMIDASSEAGKEIIKENNITLLPSLIVSEGIEEYWWFSQQLSKSFIQVDGNYKFNEPMFPSKEISSGKIKGKTKAIYIVNNSCEDCFNVSVLKNAFQQLGVYIESERYLDISTNDGTNLVKKYNITAIPTVIFSEEISDYTTITEILEKVGIFKNKEFVFTKHEILKVNYQQLK